MNWRECKQFFHDLMTFDALNTEPESIPFDLIFDNLNFIDYKFKK